MALADGLVTWIHLVCAAIWVGGSVFLGIVLVPVLKKITTTEELVGLMVKVGRRFNKIAIPSFGLLVVTGIYNARAFFGHPEALLGTSYGIILIVKIIFVIATIATYAIHIRLLNAETEKKLTSGSASSVYVQSVRSKIIHFGRVTVFLSVIILLLAALLDSGASL